MGLSGLLAVLFSGLDMKATIGGKHHYLLFCLAASMQPRMLMTLDESGGEGGAAAAALGPSIPWRPPCTACACW